jgi:hypothetical protein
MAWTADVLRSLPDLDGAAAAPEPATGSQELAFQAPRRKFGEVRDCSLGIKRVWIRWLETIFFVYLRNP